MVGRALTARGSRPPAAKVQGAGAVASANSSADYVEADRLTVGRESHEPKPLRGEPRLTVSSVKQTMRSGGNILGPTPALFGSSDDAAAFARDWVGVFIPALRQAMLSLVDGEEERQFAHPMLWAPFVVVGEGAPGR